jgi:hypothetical protein
MDDDDPRRQRAPRPAVGRPADTSTDWDEWMERHADRPPPVADVADAHGRFRPVAAAEQEAALATREQRSAARGNVRKAARAAKSKKTIAPLPRHTRLAPSRQAAKTARRKRTGRSG